MFPLDLETTWRNPRKAKRRAILASLEKLPQSSCRSSLPVSNPLRGWRLGDP